MDFSDFSFSMKVLEALGALKPPSSLSSCFCGQRMCFNKIARIMAPKTNIQNAIRMQVRTQPIQLMAEESKALPIANVAVISAVFGKMKENQVMANSRPPCPIHVQ